MADIIKLDQEVASDQAEVETLIKKIRPSWESDDFTVEPLHGGLINRLWKATHINDDDDAICVKIHGHGQDFFDRGRELRLMETLHRHAIVPPVYAIFSNGYAYKFAEGGTLTPQQLLDLKVSRLVIEKMHQIQELDLPDYTSDRQEQVTELMKQWYSMKEIFKEEQSYNEFFDHEDFCKAIDAVKEKHVWLRTDFPIRPCHGDMHSLNLIYNEKKGELAVIDWEELARFPVVVDIARHLCMDLDGKISNAGIVIPEQKDFIEQFVRLYLETRPGHKKEGVTQEMVDKWMHGVYVAMENTLLLTNAWLLIQWQKQKEDSRGFFKIAKMFEATRRVTTKMIKEGLK